MEMQEEVVVVFVVCAGGVAAVWIRRWILLVVVHGDGGAMAGVDGCYEFGVGILASWYERL
jgi:hypothetical protein